MNKVRLLASRLPKAAAGAGDHRQDAKHKIDRDDAADLIQRRSGISESIRLDRLAEAAPRPEVHIYKEQHHRDAGALWPAPLRRVHVD